MILGRSLIALACLLPTAQAAADSLPGATLAREIETRLLAALAALAGASPFGGERRVDANVLEEAFTLARQRLERCASENQFTSTTSFARKPVRLSLGKPRTPGGAVLFGWGHYARICRSLRFMRSKQRRSRKNLGFTDGAHLQDQILKTEAPRPGFWRVTITITRASLFRRSSAASLSWSRSHW